MKKFMAVFIGSEDNPKAAQWEALDEKARGEREAAGIAAWKSWAMKNAKSIVDMGAPLGTTKKVDENGVSDSRNQLTAYTVVQAESHEAAARLFLNHPHFTLFPGDSIEIMECLPIPGM